MFTVAKAVHPWLAEAWEMLLACSGLWVGSIPEWGEGVKLIYRHYATLYFVFAVDQQESDLGILDLIQGEHSDA